MGSWSMYESQVANAKANIEAFNLFYRESISFYGELIDDKCERKLVSQESKQVVQKISLFILFLGLSFGKMTTCEL